jgi:YD repeat-containing protein
MNFHLRRLTPKLSLLSALLLITTAAFAGTAYYYDPSDRLLRIETPDDTYKYYYDAAGNRTMTDVYYISIGTLVLENGYFFLDVNDNFAVDIGIDILFPFGDPNDLRVTGDWDGCTQT